MTDLLGRAGGAIPAHLGHSVKSGGTAALGVLDDRHGKAVTVGVGIGHGGSAYLELVRAHNSTARCDNMIEQERRSTRRQERSQQGFRRLKSS